MPCIGKRSEKLTEDERQLAFEDLSIALAEVEAEKKTRATKAGDGTARPAPKRTIGNLPAALPRIEEVIEPDSLICPCGCGIMHKIGEDRSERLDIVPAQLRVIVTVRPKYACRTCTDGVTQAPTPAHLIMGGLPTEPSRKGGAPIRVAHCWAHARRKLKEVFDRDGSEIAAEGLRRIAQFYAVEADIRGVSPGQRLSARQARAAPLVAAFGGWLQAQRRKISAKSRLGEKLTYIHNQWDGLQTFLTDGRVEIDSNRVENLVRPIALNRKNALFAGHDEGGIAGGRIASLIETCNINGIEPFAYLNATLTAIAKGHPQSRIDDLLPWGFKPSS